MMARGIGIVACLALLVSSGCVCRGPCGVIRDPLGACEPDCGHTCMPALNYDRVWRGGPCNDCGPGGCGTGSYYRCGLLPMLRAHLHGTATCGRGCGEVYWGEWVSDPPDCCDPCNSCGDWQGRQCCSPTLAQRLWWGAHGYRLGGQHGDANCCGGCTGCGGGAVASASYYEGGVVGKPGCNCGGHGGHSHGEVIHPAPSGNILHENWNNEPLPTSNQPTHQAKRPVPPRTATRMPVRTPVSQAQPSTPARSPRPWSPVAANQMR